MENKTKISFDFDGTLDRKHIQQYAKYLVKSGFEVWIVTSRFDKEHYIKQFQIQIENDINNDLFKAADELGIKRQNIHFTNMENKYLFFIDKDFIFHLDDDWTENKNILKYTKTKGIDSLCSSWKQKCQRILKQRTNDRTIFKTKK